MNIYSLPATIAFTINFSIALLVFLDNPKKILNRWFAGFVLIFAFWNLSEIIILNGSQYEKALFGAQILYRVLFFVPAFFLIISYIFPRPNKKFVSTRWLHLLIFAVPILILAFSFPDFKISLLPLSELKNVYYYQIKITLDPTIILLLVVALAYIGLGTFNLIRKLERAKTNRERNQILFLLIAVLSIFIIYIFVNAFNKYYGKAFSFYFFSTLLTLFISFFFFAAIMQYKLLRLPRLITGGLTYTLLSSIILAIYFVVVRGLSESLSRLFQINSFLFEAFLILTLIILIRPFESRIQRIIDRLLYKKFYSYRRKFLDFSRKLLTYYDRNTFLQKIIHFIQSNFQPGEVVIFLKDENSGNFRIWNQNFKLPPISKTDFLPQHLSQAKVGVEFFDLDYQKIPPVYMRFFKQINAALFLPLVYESELIGFNVLTKKKNKKLYSQEEIEILSIFSNEIAITYVRNQIIEKMREEERQRSRIERLAAIGQLTAGVAHEIRNPLNTIATSAETLIKKKLDAKLEAELKSYILEETNRLNYILTDFLKLSRIREPKRKSVKVSDFLEKLTLDVQSRIDETIKFKLENRIRKQFIQIDQGLVHQVLLNLLLNGIDAIWEKQKLYQGLGGKLVLRAARLKSFLQFKVEDNGIGIPPEHWNSIFNPFFTTKVNGTGLGLSVASNTIEIMNGNLRFETSEDWTRFIVTIPDKKQI